MKDQLDESLEARATWPLVAISEIADHCLGKMLDKHKNKGTPRPYLRNLNVRWFGFDTSDVLEMRFEDHEAERYQARKGDLIVCEGGYPGRAAIWQEAEPMFLQKALHRVRFHEPERARWVLYWLYLNDLRGSLSDAFSGTGIQHFTKAALSRFQVPLPPLEEQKRIVAVLDQALAALDRARAHAEANLADAEALFDTHLAKVFADGGKTWSSCCVGDVIALQRGFDITKKDQSVGTFPVISSGGAKSFHDEARATAPGVVVGRKGSIGTVHFIEQDFWPHDTTLFVKDFKESHPLLVFYLLRGLKLADLDTGAATHL